MQSWRSLETELVDIIKRSCTDTSNVEELANGDKALGKYSLGEFYEILNISELARELDAIGVRCKALTSKVPK